MSLGRKPPKKPEAKSGADSQFADYLEQMAAGGGRREPPAEGPKDAGALPQPAESRRKPAIAEFTPDERRLIWAVVTTMTENADLGFEYLTRPDAPGIGKETAAIYMTAKKEYDEAKGEGMEKARKTPFRQARQQLFKKVEDMHKSGDKDTARDIGRKYFRKGSKGSESAMNTLLSERAQKAFEAVLSN